MKKRVLALGLAVIMMLSLAGCVKKATYTMKVEGIGNYQVIDYPDNLDSYSVKDNDIEVRFKKDGEYNFTVKNDVGDEYTFTVTKSKSQVQVTSKDHITVTLGGVR